MLKQFLICSPQALFTLQTVSALHCTAVQTVSAISISNSAAVLQTLFANTHSFKAGILANVKLQKPSHSSAKLHKPASTVMLEKGTCNEQSSEHYIIQPACFEKRLRHTIFRVPATARSTVRVPRHRSSCRFSVFRLPCMHKDNRRRPAGIGKVAECFRAIL